VYVLDDETGEKISKIEFDGFGEAAIPLLNNASLLGFLVQAPGFRDLYRFHVPLSTSGSGYYLEDTIRFIGVDEATYASIQEEAGIDFDPTKGLVFGYLYFEANSDAVGCATVKVVDGVEDAPAFYDANVRYGNASGTFAPLDKQTQTNQVHGSFLVGNLPPQATLKAFVGDTPIGEALATTRPGAVTLVDIYTYTEETAPAGVAPIAVNPQPKPCTK
jgi:hypothetical protein